MRSLKELGPIFPLFKVVDDELTNLSFWERMRHLNKRTFLIKTALLLGVLVLVVFKIVRVWPIN